MGLPAQNRLCRRAPRLRCLCTTSRQWSWGLGRARGKKHHRNAWEILNSSLTFEPLPPVTQKKMPSFIADKKEVCFRAFCPLPTLWCAQFAWTLGTSGISKTFYWPERVWIVRVPRNNGFVCLLLQRCGTPWFLRPPLPLPVAHAPPEPLTWGSRNCLIATVTPTAPQYWGGLQIHVSLVQRWIC